MKNMILLGMILLLAPLAAWAVDGKVHIVTNADNAAQCIAPIEVTKIDGREATVQGMGFWIEPGKHSLSGRAIIDTSACKTVGPSTGQHHPAPLEADFELGKVYYVGLDHSSSSPGEWHYVIWKVKDAGK